LRFSWIFKSIPINEAGFKPFGFDAEIVLEEADGDAEVVMIVILRYSI